MTYGSLWRNVTRENVYARMMPTTAVEIGEGFVIGIERTVTQVSVERCESVCLSLCVRVCVCVREGG